MPNQREITLRKMREELARVQEAMRRPGQSQGLMRGLRKLEAELEREIAEVERLS